MARQVMQGRCRKQAGSMRAEEPVRLNWAGLALGAAFFEL